MKNAFTQQEVLDICLEVLDEVVDPILNQDWNVFDKEVLALQEGDDKDKKLETYLIGTMQMCGIAHTEIITRAQIHKLLDEVIEDCFDSTEQWDALESKVQEIFGSSEDSNSNLIKLFDNVIDAIAPE